jgi:hypothetical protein
VVRLFDGVEDSYGARALIYLAGLLDDLDRGAEAVEYVRRAIDAARPFGTDWQVAAAMGLGSVLSERGDPEAALYAAEAIELCHASGSAEQLAAALPTAATVCWQVGALDEARAFVDEAQPMHGGGKRIARVVLFSVAAGLALAEGDVAAAIDFGSTADSEGTELGVEREMPLIRSVLARALLAGGDLATDLEPRRLLVIDWAPNPGEGDKILYIFDCGHLGGNEAQISLGDGELDRWERVPVSRVGDYLIPRLTRRVTRAHEALGTGIPLYLEHGDPVAAVAQAQ